MSFIVAVFIYTYGVFLKNQQELGECCRHYGFHHGELAAMQKNLLQILFLIRWLERCSELQHVADIAENEIPNCEIIDVNIFAAMRLPALVALIHGRSIPILAHPV